LLAALGRSGVYQPIGNMVQWMAHYSGIMQILMPKEPRPPAKNLVTNFELDGNKPFEEYATQYGLTYNQVFFGAAMKMLLWHWGQVFYFIFAWYSMVERMGHWQKFFAAIVLVKEIAYGWLIFAGTSACPHFLMFSPMSDENRLLTAKYFFTPDLFILDCMNLGDMSLLSLDMSGVLNLIMMIGSVAAVFAILLGLYGYGCMSPALLGGYALAAGGLLIYVYFGLRPVGGCLTAFCNRMPQCLRDRLRYLFVFILLISCYLILNIFVTLIFRDPQ